MSEEEEIDVETTRSENLHVHPEVPIERQRMLLRPWLELHLEMGDVPGLEWVDRSRAMFRILWKHRSKGNWTSLHGAVFVEWAKNTGRYSDNMDSRPNYAHLKTRLRCAINKAPDIEEVESLTNMRAYEPYKVYKFLPKPAPRVSFHQPKKRKSSMAMSSWHTAMDSEDMCEVVEEEEISAEDCNASIPETVLAMQEDGPSTTQVLWVDTDTNIVRQFETSTNGINALVEAARMSSEQKASGIVDLSSLSSVAKKGKSGPSKEIIDPSELPPVARAEVIDLSTRETEKMEEDEEDVEETEESEDAVNSSTIPETEEPEEELVVSDPDLIRQYEHLEACRFALEVKEDALRKWEHRLRAWEDDLRSQSRWLRLKQARLPPKSGVVLAHRKKVEPKKALPDGLAMLSDVATNKDLNSEERVLPPLPVKHVKKEADTIVIRPMDVKEERKDLRVIVERLSERV